MEPFFQLPSFHLPTLVHHRTTPSAQATPTTEEPTITSAEPSKSSGDCDGWDCEYCAVTERKERQKQQHLNGDCRSWKCQYCISERKEKEKQEHLDSDCDRWDCEYCTITERKERQKQHLDGYGCRLDDCQYCNQEDELQNQPTTSTNIDISQGIPEPPPPWLALLAAAPSPPSTIEPATSATEDTEMMDIDQDAMDWVALAAS